MEAAGRPNRSDTHLSKEEEAKIEESTRGYFDGIAPKRHSKPQRSETNTDAAQYNDGDDENYNDAVGTNPELIEFQRLENNTEKLMVYTAGNNIPLEEFTETEYYKDLNCVDKHHHHTTGTGFINVADASKSNGFMLVPDSDTDHHPSSRGNPATNDWIPSLADPVSLKSDKPGRSDN